MKNNIFFLLVCLIAVTPLMKILGERQRSSMRRAQDIRRKKLLRREQQELGESFGDESLREFSQFNEEEGEGVGEEDGHSLAYRRLQRRIRSRRRAAGRAEALYYLERGIIALGLLGLAVMAMVGNSYVPFLYNQF
jgi:alginate O-acetyltransferase complex protein AlgI